MFKINLFNTTKMYISTEISYTVCSAIALVRYSSVHQCILALFILYGKTVFNMLDAGPILVSRLWDSEIHRDYDILLSW